MFETMYLVTATVGGVSLLFALGLYRWHNEVELFSAIAFGAWAILTFESAAVTVRLGDGSTQVVSSFPMQLLCFGLALVSALAIVGAVTGRWPAEDDRPSKMEAPV